MLQARKNLMRSREGVARMREATSGIAEFIIGRAFARPVGSPGLRELCLQPPPRRLRLHPFEIRQLMPKPGELPLGIVAGIGAADLGGLLQCDLTVEIAD